MTDPSGDASDALTLWVQIFSFSCSFSGKLATVIGWRPLLWEILDLPLNVSLSQTRLNFEDQKSHQNVVISGQNSVTNATARQAPSSVHLLSREL